VALPQAVERPARTPSSLPSAVRIMAVFALGLLAGASTSILQKSRWAFGLPPATRAVEG